MQINHVQISLHLLSHTQVNILGWKSTSRHGTQCLLFSNWKIKVQPCMRTRLKQKIFFFTKTVFITNKTFMWFQLIFNGIFCLLSLHWFKFRFKKEPPSTTHPPGPAIGSSSNLLFMFSVWQELRGIGKYSEIGFRGTAEWRRTEVWNDQYR